MRRSAPIAILLLIMVGNVAFHWLASMTNETTPNPSTGLEKISKNAQLTDQKKSIVAVYVNGQARTFNRTWCSIVENIFQPLKDSNHEVFVFVAAERDAFSNTYSEILRYLQAQKVLKIGDIVIEDRPPVEKRSNLKYGTIEEKEPERHLIPRKCFEELVFKGRWFHGGGTSFHSKNGIYTAEVLSQLYFRRRVDELRQTYEEVHDISFDWIISARPDNVYIEKLPDPRFFMRRDTNYSDRVYAVNWGHGSSKRSLNPVKRVQGINNRFSMGGRTAMSKLMRMYDYLCFQNITFETIPAQMNLEQLTYWYLSEFRNVRVSYFPSPVPFLFYRLRINSVWPLEHPNHRPALTSANRLERLRCYKSAIDVVDRCQNTSRGMSTYGRGVLEEKQRNCIWNVSARIFLFFNIFLSPDSLLHKYVCVT